MKIYYTFFLVLLSYTIQAQVWVDCNEMLITVDDFNTTLDFENQPADCGCNISGGSCTLVRVKMVETINGVETPVSFSTINLTHPTVAGTVSTDDYIDVFNPYSTCREYQSEGQLNHNYKFSPVAPPGHELHLLVCPGSESGPMQGRFFSLSPGTSLAAPTNVQASDGQTSIAVSFDAVPGKYYMAYRSTENCNQSWTPIDPSMPWPQASGSSMTLTPNSFIPDQQFEYRVVASDNGFVVASGTDGAWSEGDLGHYGTLNVPYDTSNDCSQNTGGNDCSNDTDPPNCLSGPFTVELDPGQDYYTFDINDFTSDDCDDVLTYENAYLDPSTLNGTNPSDEVVVGSNDQFSCGTYTITSSSIFDDLGNFQDCGFTFTVECGGGTPPKDTCIIEPGFSELRWSSYLGGDGYDETVDVFVDGSTGIQYLLGKTSSSNFYSTNPVIGSSSDSLKTFIVAINPDASLLWSTLISGWDDPHAIDMDPDGHLTLVGVTKNPTLPGAAGLPGYDKSHNGGKDILILKLEQDGTDILYSSYFGGSGDDANQTADSFGSFGGYERLKVDFGQNKIYILGGTNSTDLPLLNEVDVNSGDAFAAVLNLSLSNSLLDFSTYFKQLNGGITAISSGGFAVVVNNGGGDYSNLISTNAIESGYSGFAPLPILIVFSDSYDINYASYIGAFRAEGDAPNCDIDIFNGTPQSPNFFDYELKSDQCNNIYWYSKSQGFRGPLFSQDYLLPARKYRPALDSYSDSCSMNVGSPLIKINFSDEPDPFIEFMLFFGYIGEFGASSSFDIDNSNRIHLCARQEVIDSDPNIVLPAGVNFQSDAYIVFENDLSSAEVKHIGDGLFASPSLNNGIKVFDNKAFVFGEMGNVSGYTTPSWTDENSNTNTIIQSSFAGGDTDGFITVIDNNELCDGCAKDSTECNSIALNFTTNNETVSLNGIGANSDFSLGCWFKADPNSNGGPEDRVLSFGHINRLELGLDENGYLWRFDQNNPIAGPVSHTNNFVRDGEWHHIAFVAQGNTRTLYLDFVEIESYTASSINYGPNLTIGNWAGPMNQNAYFSGSIDEVRGYSTALSTVELCEESNSFPPTNQADLQIYFDFEEGLPSANNTTLSTANNQGLLQDADLLNFSLMGSSSNFICADIDTPSCPSECELDNTDPLVACPINTAYLFEIGQDGYTPSILDFDIDVIDDCRVSFSFSPASFDCDDLGLNQVTVTVTDEAGNAGACTIGFTLLDTKGRCDTITVDTLTKYSKYIGDTLNNYHTQVKHFEGSNYILGYNLIEEKYYPHFTKVNSSGDIDWSTRFIKEYRMFDFELLDNGNFLIVGRTEPIQLGNAWQDNKSAMFQIRPNGSVFMENTFDNPGRESLANIIRHPYPTNDDFPIYMQGFQNREGDSANSRDRVTLCNLDGNGNINWSVVYSNNNDDQFGRFLAPLSDGNLLLGGTVQISGPNFKSSLVKVSGADGHIIKSISSDRLEDFRLATEVGNSRILVASTTTNRRYLTLLDSNLNPLSNYEIQISDFKDFSDIEVLQNGLVLITGLKPGDQPAFAYLNVTSSNEIQFNSGLFLSDNFSGTNPKIDVIGNSIIYADSRDHEFIQDNGHEITLNQFNFDNPLECFTAFNDTYTLSSTVISDDPMQFNDYNYPASSNSIDVRPNNILCSINCGFIDPCEIDTLKPICLTQDINIILDEDGQATITPDMIDVGSYDECSQVTLSIEGQQTFFCNDIGTREVVLVVTDESNNSTPCPVTVTIEDKQSPTCISQDLEFTITSANSGIVIGAEDINNGSFDNCNIVSYEIDKDTFFCSDEGENIVTLTITDESGNPSNCTATVNIICDSDDPTCIFSCTEECSTESVNVSTGIDSNDNSFLAIGAYDANWTLINSPDPGIQTPRPAFVLNPNSVWAQLPGSQYISAYPDASNNASNIVDGTFYEFEKCFCVCDDLSEVTIDLAAYVDNNLEILLYDSDDNEVESLLDITTTTAAAFTGNPDTSTTILNLESGVYCLRARLKNDARQTMGMSIEAYISGIGLIENQCCKSYNAITGSVYQDVLCDGAYQFDSDFPISDWEVQLCSGSNIVSSIMTDDFGYYSVNNIEPGIYTIKATNPEMNQSSSPLMVEVSIGINEVVGVDFGFCDVDVCCIEQDSFNNIVSPGIYYLGWECNAAVRPLFEVNKCYESVIKWDDGTVDNFVGDYFAQHTYAADGEYNICVETINRDADGEICNVIEECSIICITCDQECTEENLLLVEFMQGSNYFPIGSINKHSDVWIDETGYYGAYVEEEGGMYTFNILHNGSVTYQLSSMSSIQVSEIQRFNNDFFIVGSFVKELIIPTNLPQGDIILTADCKSETNCQADALLIKLNQNYEVQWAFDFGSSWTDVVEDITMISEDEFAITGKTRVEVDFDPRDNVEVLCGQENSIKSYVAKYSGINATLPQCDWVTTIYMNDNFYGASTGTGISHDPAGNIYVVGDHGTGNFTNTSDLVSTATSVSLPENTFATVPAENNFGYLAKYTSAGELSWIQNIENTSTSGEFIRSIYPNDVLVDDQYAYIGGLHTIAKYDFNGTAVIGPITHNGMDIEEMSIMNDELYLAGFVNGQYRNLDLFANPVTNGPQISSGGDVLLSVYDKEFQYLKSINPGGYNDRNHAQAISTFDGQVVIGANFVADIFYPNYPLNSYDEIIRSSNSSRDFFVGLYECSCSEFDSSDGFCCDGFSSVLKEEENGEYCCSISFVNDQETNVSSIIIETLGGGEFSAGQINLDDDYSFSLLSSSEIEISHGSGSIPDGTTSPLLDFCLDQAIGSNQQYVISYVAIDGSLNEFVACRDTLIGDCGMDVIPEPEGCANVSNIITSCQSGREPIYEVNFTITNESNSSIDAIQLSGLPQGYNWSPCDVDPPIINTVYDVDISLLQPGQSTQICINLISLVELVTDTDINFSAVMIDEGGKSFCCAHDLSMNVIPCCDSCEDVIINVEDISECCYSVTMSGFCNQNDYRELNISASAGVSIVNSNVTSLSSFDQVWSLCDTGEEDLCVLPVQGLFTDQIGASEITFCLSGTVSDPEELSFDFRNDKSDVLCTKIENVQCNGGCVPEGFRDPVLTSIGFVDEKFRLECDQPPLILTCPLFSEVFIKGRFDCSENCTANITVSVFLNGMEIIPNSTDNKDETWEIRLTDLLKNDGLYEVLVEGDCDGQIQSCTYAFEVKRDCFDCQCNELENDLDLGFSINNYNGCTLGVRPNGLKECDEVLSYSFNAIKLSGPFLFDQELSYEIPQSGQYIICMEVERVEQNGTVCIDQICEEYGLICKSQGVNGLFCEDPISDNGDFSQGIQGSIHDNSKSFLPGWELLSGEAWYFDRNGSSDTTSGYVTLAYADKVEFEDAFLITSVNDNGVLPSDSNVVRVFHDVNSQSGGLQYTLAAVIDSDTIYQESTVTHENIWESKLITFQVTSNQMDEIEEDGLQVGLVACCDPEIESSDDDHISFDNICIEIEKMTVSTEIIQGKNLVKVFPNPTSGKVNFEILNGSKYQYHLRNTVGQLVLSGQLLAKEESIDLNLLPSGVYILSLNDDSRSIKQSFKIIKI